MMLKGRNRIKRSKYVASHVSWKERVPGGQALHQKEWVRNSSVVLFGERETEGKLEREIVMSRDISRRETMMPRDVA